MTKYIFVFCAIAILIPAVGAQQPAPDKAIAPGPSVADEKVAQLEKRIAEDDHRLQDWPNLARYREANAKLPAPAAEENRAVFMGDSITEGWSLPQNGGFFPGKPYVNRGISGQTTPQMLLRFRFDVINLHPKVVLIMGGTNDIAGNTGVIPIAEIEGNLASMAELAHANGIQMILSSVTPVSDILTPDGRHLVQTANHPQQTILELNTWLKKYAAEHRHIYLDYFSAMADEKGFLKNELTNDGLHPNEHGYAVMSPLAEKAIAQALNTKP